MRERKCVVINLRFELTIIEWKQQDTEIWMYDVFDWATICSWLSFVETHFNYFDFSMLSDKILPGSLISAIFQANQTLSFQ